MDAELTDDHTWAQRSVELLRQAAADSWVLHKGWFMRSSSEGDPTGPWLGFFVEVVNPQDPEGCVTSLSCAVRETVGASVHIEDQSGNDVAPRETTPGLRTDAGVIPLTAWVKECVEFVNRTAPEVNNFLIQMSPPWHYTFGLDLLSARTAAARNLRWRWRELWIDGVQEDQGPILMYGSDPDGLTVDARMAPLKALGAVEYCLLEGLTSGSRLAITVEYFMESRIELSVFDGSGAWGQGSAGV